MPRWNNPKCGFQKGHKEFRKPEVIKRCSDVLRQLSKERVRNGIKWGFKKWKYTGDHHWNWQGGTADKRQKIQSSAKYIKWRLKIFKRDNFTCQKCSDNRGGNLVAHHIKNFENNVKMRFWIKNGITFCSICHKSFHDLFGYRNNNGYQLKKYIRL